MTILLAIIGAVSVWIGFIFLIFGISDTIESSKLSKTKLIIATVMVFTVGMPLIIYIASDSLEVVETNTFITNNYGMYELAVDSDKLGVIRVEKLESTRFGLDTKQTEYYFEGFVEE